MGVGGVEDWNVERVVLGWVDRMLRSDGDEERGDDDDEWDAEV